jgi:hypothetical protein
VTPPITLRVVDENVDENAFFEAAVKETGTNTFIIRDLLYPSISPFGV